MKKTKNKRESSSMLRIFKHRNSDVTRVSINVGGKKYRDKNRNVNRKVNTVLVRISVMYLMLISKLLISPHK